MDRLTVPTAQPLRPPGIDAITQARLLEFAAEIHAAETRCLIGLTGPPGSGKSTLAAHLAERNRSLEPSRSDPPMGW